MACLAAYAGSLRSQLRLWAIARSMLASLAIIFTTAAFQASAATGKIDLNGIFQSCLTDPRLDPIALIANDRRLGISKFPNGGWERELLDEKNASLLRGGLIIEHGFLDGYVDVLTSAAVRGGELRFRYGIDLISDRGYPGAFAVSWHTGSGLYLRRSNPTINQADSSPLAAHQFWHNCLIILDHMPSGTPVFTPSDQDEVQRKQQEKTGLGLHSALWLTRPNATSADCTESLRIETVTVAPDTDASLFTHLLTETKYVVMTTHKPCLEKTE